MISTLCLFLLLGGGAYAATKLPKNSVGTKQLRKNAVTGAKVKDKSLTGNDINTSTLGTVPTAAQATNAAALAGLGPAAFERSGHLVQISARMANTDPDRTILQAGPFTVTAHCAAANSQQNFIRALLTTSENDSAVHGVNTFGVEDGNADLDVGVQETIGQYQEGGTPPNPAGPFEATMNMFSPSGTNVFVSLALGTRLFSDNASQRTACVFAGYAVVS